VSIIQRKKRFSTASSAANRCALIAGFSWLKGPFAVTGAIENFLSSGKTFSTQEDRAATSRLSRSSSIFFLQQFSSLLLLVSFTGG
jgi:hypothetical protein